MLLLSSLSLLLLSLLSLLEMEAVVAVSRAIAELTDTGGCSKTVDEEGEDKLSLLLTTTLLSNWSVVATAAAETLLDRKAHPPDSVVIKHCLETRKKVFTSEMRHANVRAAHLSSPLNLNR